MRSILDASLFLFVAALATSAATAADADRLNVLFITSDDLGLQLSCYGDTVVQTPHLDALAERGTRFEVAYITQASCSPSRSSMFTGRYPHGTGQYGLVNRDDSQSGFRLHEPLQSRTIPALLKQAGYRTGIIGKLHVAPEKSFPFDVRPRANTREVRSVAAAAESFLKDSDAEPFFLMVNYSDPHAFRESRQSRDWYFPDQIDGLPADPVKSNAVPPWPFQRVDEPSQLVKIAGYYNCVKRLDEGVGMLLEVLEASGKRDETLVIFVGDHGPPFARGKTTCYEAGLRVPFIVDWPGVSVRQSSPAMVSTVDVLPTILDAVGVPIPDGVHGRSLRPVLAERDAPWREYLAAEFHFHGARPFYPRRCIRDARYHLIHNLRAGKAKPSSSIDGDKATTFAQRAKYAGTPTQAAFDVFKDPPEFELYDLSSDPAELANLAGDPAVADVEGRLKAALLSWRQRTDDPFLDPDKVAEYAE